MRQKTSSRPVLLVGLLSLFLFSPHFAIGQEATRGTAATVRITSDGGQAVIVLYDTPASRDFMSLLPLVVDLRDYAGKEKIAYLPRKLTTQGGLTGSDAEGDFAYYAPWGNLAVFYKGFGKGERLYILGRIESGKEWLAEWPEGFTARIEVVN